MHDIETRRLATGDRELARTLFTTMSDVFGEEHDELTDSYINGLLGDRKFWAIAALSGGRVVGGITAHVLPLTSKATSEMFVYDIAVRADFRRRGIGRRLVRELIDGAAKDGIKCVCIPAESGDVPALDFYRALGGEELAVAYFVFEREGG